MTERQRVAVVGGGATGLAAAVRLAERAATVHRELEIVLYEASARLGGVIRTVRRDGFLIEEGPDSILLERPDTRGFVDRLGLASRLVEVAPEARRSFVARGRRLIPIPAGLLSAAPGAVLPLLSSPLLSPRGKLTALLEPFRPARRDAPDESVADFVRRRFGEELYDAIAEPLIAGIYGADPEGLSMRATLPRLAALERERGSVVGGIALARRESLGGGGAGERRSLAAFAQGMETLVEGLSRALAGCTVRLAEPVHGVAPAPDAAWRVTSSLGEQRFAAVVLAAPAPAAAALLRAADAELAALLAEIPYRSSSTLSLAFGPGTVDEVGGLGFVVSRREGMLLRACSASHAKFPGRAPARHTLLRAYYGEEAGPLSDRELTASALEEIGGILGVRGEPLFAHRVLYEGARPHYRVGHRELVSRVRSRAALHRGLQMAGSAFDGVGLPDVLASGTRAADAIWEALVRPGASAGH